MSSNLIVIYENDLPILEWFVPRTPAFRTGETLWLEIASYPVWQHNQPKTMKLTEFKIINISHSILVTYTSDISTFYKIEIIVEKV